MELGYNFAAPAVALDSTSAANARSSKTENQNEFSMNDFYKLFATQLQNQDMMNPVDDSQFLAQMTQMTMIQAMEKMNEMTMSSYAFNFMGKDVIVADYDALGTLITSQGSVEKVILYNGVPQVFVNGNAYGVAQVMEVFEKGTLPPAPETPGNEEDPASGEIPIGGGTGTPGAEDPEVTEPEAEQGSDPDASNDEAA